MKRLLFSLVLAFAVVSLQAQLLWKVSGNGLVKDSYILGTVHIVPAYVMDIIPGLNTALENCDVVVGETDIKDDNPDEPNGTQHRPTARLISCSCPRITA